jgi:hypothetical protein
VLSPSEIFAARPGLDHRSHSARNRSTSAAPGPITVAMNVASVSSSIPGFAGISNNPALAGAQSAASVTSALLSSPGTAPTGLDALLPAAVDYAMYAAPGLMQNVVKATLAQANAAASASSSTPAPAPATTPAAPAPAKFAFNPFDSASWWTSSSGNNVDTSS